MRIAAALGWYLTALTASLGASTIDVSSESFQQLQSGDTLEFLFSSSSYASYAAQLGISPDPDSIDFMFSSLPISASGEFTATVESFTGDGSVLFNGPLSWSSGSIQSAQYMGATSEIVGAVTLSPSQSADIFANGYADLLLTYSGPTITVGISGYTLPHDLAISLSGSSLSMGAMVYTATYQSSASAQTRFTAGPDLGGPLLPAPEPKPFVLFASGIGFCAFAGVLRRWTRRRASL